MEGWIDEVNPNGFMEVDCILSATHAQPRSGLFPQLFNNHNQAWFMLWESRLMLLALKHNIHKVFTA